MSTFSMGYLLWGDDVVGVGFTNAHDNWASRLSKMENVTVVGPGPPNAQLMVIMDDDGDPREFAIRVLRTLDVEGELLLEIIDSLGPHK